MISNLHWFLSCHSIKRSCLLLVDHLLLKEYFIVQDKDIVSFVVHLIYLTI